MQLAALIDCWHRTMTIAEGTQFGPHKVLEKIGSGGMGEVYRAMDTRLEREVALKLVSESFLGIETEGSPSPGSATPHSRAHLTHERFLREARSAATLSHPNICAIYDTGEQDGRPYLVMELLHGETLKQYLVNAGQPLRPDEVIAFSKQAASALAAAHSKGIVHRDIKPANLFVNEMGRDRRQIKILDFGLAKKQGDAVSGDSRPFSTDATATVEASALELTSPGSTLGTVAYMSPEQAKGLPLDARTDLFSLGTVIYEMSTNRKPFAGDSTAEAFVALLRESPPPVSTAECGNAQRPGCHRHSSPGQGEGEPISERRGSAAGSGGSGGRGHGRTCFARIQQSSGRRKGNDCRGTGGTAASGTSRQPQMAGCCWGSAAAGVGGQSGLVEASAE